VSDDLPPGTTAEEVEAYKRAAKEQLRRRVAALRRALTQAARDERSRAMCSQLATLEEVVRARVIACYMPLRFEIAPTLFMAESTGKTLALPRVDETTNRLVLHQYVPGDELFESAFMVREPRPEAPLVAPQDVDVILVPGLAFDGVGRRLGYGQGYYDRLLADLRAVRIGLAFDFQLLAEVPSFDHDLPVHAVVTDRRVLRSDRHEL
jgi:5-formyltetrahydrofolate cyclo-ligase